MVGFVVGAVVGAVVAGFVVAGADVVGAVVVVAGVSDLQALSTTLNNRINPNRIISVFFIL